MGGMENIRIEKPFIRSERRDTVSQKTEWLQIGPVSCFGRWAGKVYGYRNKKADTLGGGEMHKVLL